MKKLFAFIIALSFAMPAFALDLEFKRNGQGNRVREVGSLSRSYLATTVYCSSTKCELEELSQTLSEMFDIITIKPIGEVSKKVLSSEPKGDDFVGNHRIQLEVYYFYRHPRRGSRGSGGTSSDYTGADRAELQEADCDGFSCPNDFHTGEWFGR
ncbi:hypothetical protein ACFLRA_01185 [Bdellovibrionota bacterium]